MNSTDIFKIQTDTVSLTHVGRVRKENEDHIGYAQTRNGHVFVVCDGMGGHVGGKEASSTAVQAVIEFFSNHIITNIPDGIRKAILYANKKVYEKAQKTPGLRGMGTTITIVVIKEDKVYIGHVGDSRIYLFSDNKLYHLTKDHSYVQELFNRGIITNEEMQHHARKNEITRALGLKSDVEPDVPDAPLLLKNGDTILMCSDGLSDMVNDKQIQEILATIPNVKEAGKILLNTALNNGGKDNISLQMIRITNSNYKKSIFVDKTNKGSVIASEITLVDETPEQNFNPVQKKTSILNKFNNKKNIIFIIIGILILFLAAWFLFSGDSDKHGKKSKKQKVEQKKNNNKSSEAGDKTTHKTTKQNVEIHTNNSINDINLFNIQIGTFKKTSDDNELKNKIMNELIRKIKKNENKEKINKLFKEHLKLKEVGNNKVAILEGVTRKDLLSYFETINKAFKHPVIYKKVNDSTRVEYIIKDNKLVKRTNEKTSNKKK